MNIRVQSGMEIRIGAPPRRAPGPAIVLMYHRGGFDDFTALAVDRLVQGGYLVAVPDVYHRSPRDLPIPARKSFLRDEEIVADVEATIAELSKRADVDVERLVVMGHCMGGRMTLLVAGSVPRFRGAVVYYGGGAMKSWGDSPSPFERLRNIRCPVIGFFGNEDKNPSPQDIDQIDAELSKNGVAHDFHRYPGVGHGFQNPTHDTALERAAAEDGWEKTFAFLRKVAPA